MLRQANSTVSASLRATSEMAPPDSAVRRRRLIALAYAQEFASRISPFDPERTSACAFAERGVAEYPASG
ncbi:MAG TPA: hypothetical protein VNO32_00460, partial [Candidatus Acidoferrum sp.]|nr:hypothetical protein [Candidatus Acidoferrum sp.]